MLTVGLSACTTEKTEAPPLSGPSELALSVSVSATPSVLTQDGVSESRIDIRTRDANGQPAPNVGMRVEITLGGAIFDFGRLSSKSVVTDGNGQASVVYVAPPPPAEPVDTGTVVTIRITPSTSDNRSSLARTIDIRLVPAGVVLPPNLPPRPAFTFSPVNPVALTDVHFDASSSNDLDGAIVSYHWDFGDGGTGSGVQIDHEYEVSGQYSVVLTVTDNRGSATASVPQSVTVGASTGPTADFTISPESPGTGQKVFFNASASTATEGRKIVSYKWNFGKSNGTSASGITVSTTYDVTGSYTVVLVVKDDAGQEGTKSKSVFVEDDGAGGVTAAFSYSPGDPAPGTEIFFDASGSTSPNDIVSFIWNFGDGHSATGQFPSHTYTDVGEYVVTLTIRDSRGKEDQISHDVSVQ